jgi:hypothetical protein
MRIDASELLTYLDTLEEGAAARVLASLHRTAMGNGLEDYVTPLIPDGDADTWRQVLSIELLANLHNAAKLSWLGEAEAIQQAKIGAYSQMVPYAERRENVHAYFAINSGTPDLDLLSHVANGVSTEIMPSGLEPQPLHDAVSAMPRGTNLGAPFFISDDRLRHDVFRLALEVEEKGFQRDTGRPALIFWRGQPRGKGLISKNRTVWGISHITIAHGLRIQRAMLDYLRHKLEFAAWNESYLINKAVTEAFSRGRKQIISADFSGYDASLHPALLSEAWKVIKRSFHSRHAKLIEWLEWEMVNVPLMTPEGMISGEHAMPSGDANTNFADGLCQILLWKYIAAKLGRRLIYVTVQGDDGIVIFDRPVDLEVVSQIILHDFGMSLSTDKGIVNPDVIHYLQNVHQRYYTIEGINVHIRPIMRALNGAMSYERLVKKSEGWNGYMDTIRWWQQFENCKNHPDFLEAVKFLYDHDKYSRLPVNQVVMLSGGIDKVARALKQPSYPYGKEPLTKLSRYRVVMELSRLRAAPV